MIYNLMNNTRFGKRCFSNVKHAVQVNSKQLRFDRNEWITIGTTHSIAVRFECVDGNYLKLI